MTDDIKRIGEGLGRLTRLASRARARSVGYHGVDLNGVIVMATLVKHGPHRAVAIAEHTGMDPAVVTRHIKALGKLGFIQRDLDPSDGRAVIVSATPSGHEFFQYHVSIKEAFFSEIFRSWNPSDVALLGELLQRFSDDMEKSLNSRTPNQQER